MRLTAPGLNSAEISKYKQHRTRLTDGRIAVVNCESKFKERFAGPVGNHRSCKRPLVDDINVDFHGDKARLEWVVSLDGKKKDTETYKILAVLPKPKPGTGQP